MNEYYLNAPRTEEENLETRVADQLQWFDKNSKKNKRWFMHLKVIEIVLSLCIPFLAGYLTTGNAGWNVAVGLLGVVIAAIAGILTLVKFQENWIEYRKVSEALQAEKFLYLAKSGPYSRKKVVFSLFVERFEGIIANSNLKWVDSAIESQVTVDADDEGDESS